MKYQFEDFEYYRDVVKFLNNHNINKDDIVAISPTTTSNHPFDNKIMLIWYGEEII